MRPIVLMIFSMVEMTSGDGSLSAFMCAPEMLGWRTKGARTGSRAQGIGVRDAEFTTESRSQPVGVPPGVDEEGQDALVCAVVTDLRPNLGVLVRLRREKIAGQGSYQAGLVDGVMKLQKC